MIGSDGVITSPGILLEDAASVLSEPEDTGSVCLSLKINPWAKDKPQFLKPYEDTMEEITDDLRRSNNWGLEIPYYTTENAIRNIINNDDLGHAEFLWKMLRNTGWHRVTDFDGYDHNARCPLPTLQPTVIMVFSADGYIDIPLPQNIISPNSLLLSDIQFPSSIVTLNQGFLGLALKIEGESAYTFYWQNTAGIPSIISIYNKELYSKVLNRNLTGKAWLFLANWNVNAGDGTLLEKKIIPLHQSKAVELTFTAFGSGGTAGGMMTINASLIYLNDPVTHQPIGANITYYFVLTVFGKGSVKFSGINASLVRERTAQWPPAQAIEYFNYPNEVTVTSNSDNGVTQRLGPYTFGANLRTSQSLYIAYSCYADKEFIWNTGVNIITPAPVTPPEFINP